MTPRTTASLVVYKTSLATLKPTLTCISKDAAISTWVVVDNAASEDRFLAQELQQMVDALGGRYLPSDKNIGFGAAHNLALRSLVGHPSEFHVMLNPDIVFANDVLHALIREFDERPGVGRIMPKILYPDGSTQFLTRLLPNPLHFALRRFLPRSLQKLLSVCMDRWELRGIDDIESTEVPFLSGCFIMTRRSALEAIGGFDERYFLYMEDVDLCRRMAERYRQLYWPKVSVTHEFCRASHRTLPLTLVHMHSAFKYFNRWGWFIDTKRWRANRTALAQLRERLAPAITQPKATQRTDLGH